ncbi:MULTISPECIES: FtsX-like permease family protein [unclassified Nocardioides]|uniref:ABC transporter permease n=1 Tax=unclassified Nocardioides TaxID=2615069 RepID=UPI000057140A|nr:MULTISPECIES: FtsX-like permease family protein [unclassified Nocardioides]ABL83277.1 protein of unknown function DUF214 [Nocardioides sp. JS614]
MSSLGGTGGATTGGSAWTPGVAARLLAASRRQSAAGAAGIALALMLMLLLTGLWAGIQERVTTYDDHTRADLVVVPPDTHTLFADPGVLPAGTTAAVGQVDGVTATASVRTMYQILELAHGKAATATVAFDPASGMGGPWDIEDGRAPVAIDEVAVDAVFADQHGLALGDRLPILGHQMRIVGRTGGTALFMTPLLFLTTDAVNDMLDSPGAAGAVLISADDPTAVRRQLTAAGYAVRTPRELHQESLSLATSIYGTPVRLMVGVAFAAGTLIVALVAYTRICEQQRDLGILKALGATPRDLRRITLAETAVLAATGAVGSVVLLLLARELLAWWRPAFPVVITRTTLVQTTTAAVAMTLLAAWLPVRRIGRLDAASAFRTGR